MQPEFTEFDGYVPEAGRDEDPTNPDGPTASASALEKLGKCPLQFFFARVLGISPPDELEREPDQWLDALQTGTLLHRTFHDFMVERVQAGELPPSYDRDLPRLLEVLEGGIKYWREKVPPPSEPVFRRERSDLRAACRYFLAGEERFCEGSEPRYLEAGIGVRASDPPTDMDHPHPLPFELPGGKAIRARARLDRVDRRADGAWSVWDYKTGSAAPYRNLQEKPYDGGRRVQHVIYLHLAERALRRLDPQARVASFGYFLPGVKGQGERVELSREQLAAGPAVVELLARTIAAGAFVPTDDHRHTCDYCDFKPVCGDVEALTDAAAGKLCNEDNDPLAPFREARSYE
jgi:ATP-dependent helicase/nuclease subunit B